MHQSPVIHAPLFGDSVEWLEMDNLLGRDRQDWLRNLATLVQYGRGETVYSQGEETRYVHIVSMGIVRVFRSAESGKRQIIAFRTPGDLCGLPETGRYINSAETVSIATIYRLPWSLFNKLMMTTPNLQLILLRKMAADVRQAQARIIMLGQENIFQRVASFLLDMIAVSQFFDAAQSELYLPMSRFDVADYLGTCPETAGRAFTKLENMGIIRRVTPRRIAILDADSLRCVQQGPRRTQRNPASASPDGDA